MYLIYPHTADTLRSTYNTYNFEPFVKHLTYGVTWASFWGICSLDLFSHNFVFFNKEMSGHCRQLSYVTCLAT